MTMNEFTWVFLAVALVGCIAYFLGKRKRPSGSDPGPGNRSDQDIR